MTILTRAQITSSAPAAAFFERWADVSTWSEWNSDTDWVRLDGPFAEGATGRLKPSGGPAVRFVVRKWAPDTEFVDVSRLIGARLLFAHTVRSQPDAGCTVAVTISMTGPLRMLWDALLGKGLRASAQVDLDNLQAVVEKARMAA